MVDDNPEDGVGDPSRETTQSSLEAAQDTASADRRGFERHPNHKARPDRKGPRRPEARPAPEPANDQGERISKVISRAGVASRRDVERMIEEGRVTLNGEIIATPVVLVKPQDRIEVDGRPLPEKERTRLFLYHKPSGLVTTEKDPEGRPTVFDALPPDLPRLVSIGRLDFNTEGLLLLTNDGGLARVLAHPSTGWLRRYRVRAFGEITQDQLDRLKDGIEIEGMHYGPVEAHVDREQGSNMWLTLGLREGKNREVKRILEHFGLKVNRLIRISFGPFRLGELPEGTVEEVRSRLLKDQLGPELAREAKVDFGDEPREAGRERGPRRDERRGGERGPDRAEGRPFRQRSDREERVSRERFSSERSPSQNEARALRKAEAIAQGQRGAAHRHSWRDPESWALRSDR
jgi:23S rRNA pseudouridine2605 synthase